MLWLRKPQPEKLYSSKCRSIRKVEGHCAGYLRDKSQPSAPQGLMEGSFPRKMEEEGSVESRAREKTSIDGCSRRQDASWPRRHSQCLISFSTDTGDLAL